ncbi:TPA: 30S ribosomal protein S9 [Candidatus Bathyarchaeota archaeon]|nr:30S ribosomal protein S9 [Candidatus Bathyarchaeota archaeon]
MVQKGKTVFVSKKRKTAIAKVVLKPGEGRIKVNNVPLEYAFPEVARLRIREVLELAGEDVWGKVDFTASINGGGIISQADALRMAIAEGLVRWTRSKKLKSVFVDVFGKSIFWDPRQREPKKFGGPGARRRKQKSYR